MSRAFDNYFTSLKDKKIAVLGLGVMVLWRVLYPKLLVDPIAVSKGNEEGKAEKAAAIEAEKAAAEEKARQERLANPTTEDLLKDILKILKDSDLG